METQALPALRPLRLGELLDRAIRLYRGNFLTFIGIVAVVYVPVTILQTVASTLMTRSGIGEVSTAAEFFSNPTYLIEMLSVFTLVVVQFVLVQSFATGALTRAVADSQMGKKTGILDAYRGIGSAWLTLLAALVFIFLIFPVLTLWWIIVPCIGWFTGFGMMVFLMAAISPLVAPVVVLEKSGPWSSPQDGLFQRFGNWILRAVFSVQRAWSLARRRFWAVLGYVFILYLFSMLVVNGPSTIVSALLSQVSQSFGNPTTQLILTSVIQGLVQLVFVLIYYPLQMTAFTLIYFDLRVRTEGFDLAILAMEASGATDPSEAMTVPVPQVNESLVTGTDLGNFAILTLAGAGIYLFFGAFIITMVLLFTL